MSPLAGLIYILELGQSAHGTEAEKRSAAADEKHDHSPVRSGAERSRGRPVTMRTKQGSRRKPGSSRIAHAARTDRSPRQIGAGCARTMYALEPAPDERGLRTDQRTDPTTCIRRKQTSTLPPNPAQVASYADKPSMPRKRSMSARGRALVKMSATCMCVGTNTGQIAPVSTTSRSQ